MSQTLHLHHVIYFDMNQGQCLWRVMKHLNKGKTAMTNLSVKGLYFYKCYADLDLQFNCKHISKMVGKLEYWFNRPQFKEGFFKFLEPCNRPSYKQGDSWTEEMGICRKVFNKAFDLIGTTYSSKTEFSANKEDLFKGKLYARYYDRQSNKTYFIRNHNYIENIFEQNTLTKHPKSQISQQNKSEKAIENTASNGQKGRSQTGQKGRSSIAKEYKQINTSSIEHEASVEHIPSVQNKKFELEEKMVKIWIDEIGSCSLLKINYTVARQLRKCWEYFGKELENWRLYCQKIASSKFLMGEKPSCDFKILFSWAIKISTIESIECGTYSLGDRKIIPKTQVKKLFQHNSVNIIHKKTIQIQKLHNHLIEYIGSIDYNNWFNYVQINDDIDKVTIISKSKFICDTIQNRFDNFIKKAINQAFRADKPYEIRCLNAGYLDAI